MRSLPASFICTRYEVMGVLPSNWGRHCTVMERADAETMPTGEGGSGFSSTRTVNFALLVPNVFLNK